MPNRLATLIFRTKHLAWFTFCMPDDASIDRWRELAARELRGADPDSLIWQTPEGIAVKPLFTAADLENLETVVDLPGVEPFVRGPRQRCTRTGRGRSASTYFPLPRNRRALPAEPRGGADGTVGRARLATHRGYDSDN